MTLRNVVVITADDLSYFSLGLSGVEYPKATNFIDSFAAQGYYFANAHANIAICEASRNVLMTGLYPQHNGCLSFDPIKEGIPTLPKILKESGYRTCILGKEGHYRPRASYAWTRYVPSCKLGGGTNHQMYVDNIKDFLKRYAGEPFFMHINSHEPHRPFTHPPIYEWQKIKVPEFIPINPFVIKDLAGYYSNVNKLDKMVKAFVEVIKEATSEPTLFIITSDHGMSFPYCKGNCYNFSNNVPMIFVGPDIKQFFDKISMVAHVDFMPTVLEYLDIERPEISQDGMSYCKLLTGKMEKFERDYVYTQFNKFVEPRSAYLCRAILNNNYCYTFNFTTTYPVWEVDGWGWDHVVANMHQKQLMDFNNRPQQELFDIRTNKLKRHNVIYENKATAESMHVMLHDVMEKYHDVVLGDSFPVKDKILIL